MMKVERASEEPDVILTLTYAEAQRLKRLSTNSEGGTLMVVSTDRCTDGFGGSTIARALDKAGVKSL